jgi:hypothetical protein
MDHIDIPKPMAIGIVSLLAVLLLAGIWWRTNSQATTGGAEAPAAIAAQEAQHFKNGEGAPTVSTGTAEAPPRD